jgi:hypothetical protein
MDPDTWRRRVRSSALIYSPKTLLWSVLHPSRKAFNGRLFARTTERLGVFTLADQGVVIRDLRTQNPLVNEFHRDVSSAQGRNNRIESYVEPSVHTR